MKRLPLSVSLAVSLISMLGCEGSKITDYQNPAWESLKVSHKLDDAQLAPFKVDGVLVLPFLPHEGHEHYDASVIFVDASPGAVCEILEFEIKGIGTAAITDLGSVKIDQPLEGQPLFRGSRYVLRKIEAEKLKRLADSNDGRVQASLSVRVTRDNQPVEGKVVVDLKKHVRAYPPIPL